MELLFYNCLSLSSLPDISKWNISKVGYFSGIFLRCTSLISIPDISKWKTNNLKNMLCLFYDCLLSLYIPDISQWNNNNKDDLDGIPNYKKINNLVNFNMDITYNSLSPGNNEIYNNMEFLSKQLKHKYERFYS